MGATTVPRDFTNLRNGIGSANKTKVQISSTPSCAPACGKLDGIAAWVLNGVAAAFFMSLDRCACIHIGTMDDPDDVENDHQQLICKHGYLELNSRRRQYRKHKGKIWDVLTS
ncbi:hypothetical protein SLEP1_g8351 [Rubroshorea leprosula]|uniref:Uncharacterized protein n=1 Tax=Rubroshorea leprosula TaxID=152421 RepID=A0AAV5ICC7_9ROSI|nr:hypothetical protein SLEP1_g8351 [Rubroshorea leprosula]